MTRIDFLAFILAALLIALTTAATFSAPATQAQCTTDTECMALCDPDDDECDGGPQ